MRQEEKQDQNKKQRITEERNKTECDKILKTESKIRK